MMYLSSSPVLDLYGCERMPITGDEVAGSACVGKKAAVIRLAAKKTPKNGRKWRLIAKCLRALIRRGS